MNILHNINVKKTPGADCIEQQILKKVETHVWKPLSTIFNASITFGKVNCDCKLANVPPIKKKADKSLPNNSRSAKLTSILCEVHKAILRNKSVSFLEVNNLIKDFKHGFRNKCSCLTNPLDFNSNVFNIRVHDETKAVDVIYLDFQKSFDKVHCKRFVNKFKSNSIYMSKSSRVSKTPCRRGDNASP